MAEHNPKASPHRADRERYEPKRHDHAREQHGWNVCNRRNERHPMEISGQQWKHSDLESDRKYGEFPQPQPNPAWEHNDMIRIACKFRRQQGTHPSRERPKVETKLGRFRRITAVAGDIT